MDSKLSIRRGAFKNWLDTCATGTEPPQVLKFQSTDVLIVGAGKSGTTWLQQILHQIRTKGDEDFSDIYDVTRFCPMYITGLPGYEIDGEQKAKPRIFKSHSNYESIPMVDGMKLIIIVRDPMDSIWSFVKFLKRHFGVDEDLTLQELQDNYNSLTLNILNPFDFFVNWFSHRDDPNTLWLHYEDLIKDLRFCVHELAKFIDIHLTEEELERINHFCTFDYMSDHKQKFSGGEWLDALMYLSKDENGWQPQIGMVRPDGGKVGQGRTLMQPDMKEYILTSWSKTVGEPLGFDTYQELYNQTSFLRSLTIE